jgi:hypothetical protein
MLPYDFLVQDVTETVLPAASAGLMARIGGFAGV